MMATIDQDCIGHANNELDAVEKVKCIISLRATRISGWKIRRGMTSNRHS